MWRRSKASLTASRINTTAASAISLKISTRERERSIPRRSTIRRRKTISSWVCYPAYDLLYGKPFSFVNNIPTPEGGYHEAGFRSGLVKALNDYARTNGFLKDKDPNFQGDDFREGLTAVLSVKMQSVQFEGQTKTKLGNTEARAPVEAAVIEGLGALMGARGYKKTFDEIIKKAQGAAKVRLAAKRRRKCPRKNSIDGLSSSVPPPAQEENPA
ncbi:MAG: hypothetical protein ACLRSW_10985 [Christensenellaceae bacterium]